MVLTVLSDEQIQGILENLSLEEIEGLSSALKCSLHEYSTGQQAINAELIHQPERTIVNSRSAGATTLFMPSLAAVGHGVKVVTLSGPDSDPSATPIKPTGSLSLYSPSGIPVGFLNAKTLTAFRTALASTCLLTKRTSVRTLTVFGAGMQAYWHIRLALMLRGFSIRAVNIINRRFTDNVKWIMRKLVSVAPSIKRREGWENTTFGVTTPISGDYSRLEREHILEADVIFCCTPSTKPLFPAEILTDLDGRRKGRLIVAVGSYTPDMREIPQQVLQQAVRSHESGNRHFHKHALEGGVIVVDTLDGALKEAGELIEAGLKPQQLVELGELVMIRRLVAQEEEANAAIAAAQAKMVESSEKPSETSSLADSLRNSLSMTPGSSALSSIFSSKEKGGSGDNEQGSTRSKSSSRRSSSNSGGVSGILKHHKRSSSASSQSSGRKQQEEKEDHMVRWLREGNVIYKSVGLGLMDLTVGFEVIKLAAEKGVGTVVPDFSPPSSV